MPDGIPSAVYEAAAARTFPPAKIREFNARAEKQMGGKDTPKALVKDMRAMGSAALVSAKQVAMEIMDATQAGVPQGQLPDLLEKAKLVQSLWETAREALMIPKVMPVKLGKHEPASSVDQIAMMNARRRQAGFKPGIIDVPGKPPQTPQDEPGGEDPPTDVDD